MVWRSSLMRKLFIFTLAFYVFAGAHFAHADAPVPVPPSKPTTFIERIKDKLFGSGEEEIDQPVRITKCSQKGRASALNNEARIQENASVYKQIFAFQQKGDFDKADALIGKLTDCRLMGHVTLQRYLHPTKFKANFSELREWLDEYADHPAAYRIHKLAQIRRPAGNRQKLKKPVYRMQLSGALESSLMEPSIVLNKGASRTNEQQAAVSKMLREVDKLISQEKPSAALDVFNTSDAAKTMNEYEKAAVRVSIAKSYLIENREKRAFALAAPAADKYGSDLSLAGWVSGLIAWKRNDMKMAANYFSKIAKSKSSNGWLTSAAAYWAARAYLRLEDPEKHTQYLKLAARYPRTFYGILAVKSLGQDLSFNWVVPTFTDDYRKKILSSEAGARAYLLTKSGQYALADNELAGLPDLKDKDMQNAVLAFALQEGLPSFAVLYGNATKNEDDRFYDAALYPLMPWLEQNEYAVNPALVHALVRQESLFRPRIVSPSGAAGLMQIMPTTAAFVSGIDGYKEKEKWKLKEPEINLQVGQDYISSLLKMRSVDNGLFPLMIAYNAGPGNLVRWKKQLEDIDDPLLFIELVPSAETRAYIERVMRNLWIYEQRYGVQSPSLDQVLLGEWPQYTSLLAR